VREIIRQGELQEKERLQKLQELPREKNPEAPFLILSMDGGGLRGLIVTIILSRILDVYPDFLSRVGLLAGKRN
jgi:hypothetical protein